MRSSDSSSFDSGELRLPTYETIGREAGVSIKTVCNVFRSPDLVRAATKEKVLRAIRRLGVEDPEVFRARLRPARVVGGGAGGRWLLCLEYGVAPAALSSPVFAEIIAGAEARSQELGWQIGLRHASAGTPLADALGGFGGEGVLFFGPRSDRTRLAAGAVRMPVVELLGPAREAGEWDGVDYDRVMVARLAAEHLKREGCRKVAYLGSPFERANYFAAEAIALGMEPVVVTRPDLFVLEGRVQTTNLESLRSAWREVAAAKPDGVFVYADQLTNALYGILATEDVRPQRDVKLVSCNAEAAFLSALDPRPATIDIHPTEIGRRAVDLLVWRIENLSAPPSSVCLRPRLIEGRKPVSS
ncbi:MAG: LacI family DNA-binding transcriptional regulator [Verrucomicrobiota bacterium]